MRSTSADNRKVMLKPCAIVFFPSGDLSRDTPQRVYVLEAPQGARLQFDSPVDLQGMKLGQLQGGEMKGPVTIHGTPSRAGANDEIFFETHDVVMSPETISTEAPVDFRFGSSTGRGRQLVLRSAADPHRLPRDNGDQHRRRRFAGTVARRADANHFDRRRHHAARRAAHDDGRFCHSVRRAAPYQ